MRCENCQTEIPEGTTHCVKCGTPIPEALGRSARRNNVVVVVVVVVATLAFGLAAFLAISAYRVNAESVSPEEYAQVAQGMTYGQVVETVGFEGELASESGSAQFYTWSSKDGSEMVCVFSSGVLVEKTMTEDQ